MGAGRSDRGRQLITCTRPWAGGACADARGCVAPVDARSADGAANGAPSAGSSAAASGGRPASARLAPLSREQSRHGGTCHRRHARRSAASHRCGSRHGGAPSGRDCVAPAAAWAHDECVPIADALHNGTVDGLHARGRHQPASGAAARCRPCGRVGVPRASWAPVRSGCGGETKRCGGGGDHLR